jgi:hypothetical protein
MNPRRRNRTRSSSITGFLRFPSADVCQKSCPWVHLRPQSMTLSIWKVPWWARACFEPFFAFLSGPKPKKQIGHHSPPRYVIADDAPATVSGWRYLRWVPRRVLVLVQYWKHPGGSGIPTPAITGIESSPVKHLTRSCPRGRWRGPRPTSQCLRLGSLWVQKVLSVKSQIPENK